MSNIPVISPAINYITRFFKDKEALHKAVQNGEREEILNLIKIGYDPNALDKFGEIPLFYATKRQDCRFYIELLLKNGASVNARDVNGRTCLHKTGKYLAKMLISYDADLNIQDKLGNTALHYAAKRGDWDLIDTLSTEENFYIKNSEGKTAFDLLIKSIENISPEARENKVGSYAKSLIKCKKYLSDNEQDIYNSSLKKLLYIGGIVDQSLIDAEGFFMNHTPIITKAAHYIVRSCFGNNGALHRAVQEGDISVIPKLLDQGYDINAKDKHGETPLMLLINRQYKGKDFDLQESKSVLHFLVRKGADINAQDNEGKTYLHKTSAPFLAKILISYGADLNIQDKLGNTALHYAAKNGNWPMINVLATKDNITIANEAGETAFDALMNGIENMEQTGKLTDAYILRSYIKTYESLNKHFTEQEQIAHLQKLSEISETMSLNFAEEQDGILGAGVSEQNSPNI